MWSLYSDHAIWHVCGVSSSLQCYRVLHVKMYDTDHNDQTHSSHWTLWMSSGVLFTVSHSSYLSLILFVNTIFFMKGNIHIHCPSQDMCVRLHECLQWCLSPTWFQWLTNVLRLNGWWLAWSESWRQSAVPPPIQTGCPGMMPYLRLELSLAWLRKVHLTFWLSAQTASISDMCSGALGGACVRGSQHTAWLSNYGQ